MIALAQAKCDNFNELRRPIQGLKMCILGNGPFTKSNIRSPSALRLWDLKIVHRFYLKLAPRQTLRYDLLDFITLNELTETCPL